LPAGGERISFFVDAWIEEKKHLGGKGKNGRFVLSPGKKGAFLFDTLEKDQKKAAGSVLGEKRARQKSNYRNQKKDPVARRKSFHASVLKKRKRGKKEFGSGKEEKKTFPQREDSPFLGRGRGEVYYLLPTIKSKGETALQRGKKGEKLLSFFCIQKGEAAVIG